MLGLAPSMVPKVAEAMAIKKRPTVIWLHFAECTGCSEAFIRSTYPWIDQIVLDVLNVAYHETIMAPSGHNAEKSLTDAMKEYDGKYILVCEGGIPTKNNGVYGKVGGAHHAGHRQEGHQACPGHHLRGQLRLLRRGAGGRAQPHQGHGAWARPPAPRP